MRRRVLSPHPGLSTGIGYYLAGMEEVRQQVQVVVKAIPDDQIGKPAFLGAHSIGGLAQGADFDVETIDGNIKPSTDYADFLICVICGWTSFDELRTN